MEVKVLEEKVQKAAEKVEKCKATIERHHKALEKKIAVLVKIGYPRELIENDIERIQWPVHGQGGGKHYWEACEVVSKRNDIKGATKKLAEAEKILSNWKEKLNKEIEKDNVVNNKAPKVIIEFLEEWKKMAYDWHVKRYEEAHELKIELNKKVMEAEAEWIKAGNSRYSSGRNTFLKEKKLDYRSVEKAVAKKAGSVVVLNMLAIKNDKERFNWLDETLEADKRAKLLNLVYRINEVCGEIKDAKGLQIRAGNLNGYIIGKKGKAEVETISAGGWNIQCFHYRTLVKPY